jgi:hypothetical protein
LTHQCPHRNEYYIGRLNLDIVNLQSANFSPAGVRSRSHVLGAVRLLWWLLRVFHAYRFCVLLMIALKAVGLYRAEQAEVHTTSKNATSTTRESVLELSVCALFTLHSMSHFTCSHLKIVSVSNAVRLLLLIHSLQKCDGAKPVCDQCQRLPKDDPCEYTDAPSRTQELHDTVERLQARIYELENAGSSSSVELGRRLSTSSAYAQGSVSPFSSCENHFFSELRTYF